MYRTLIVILLSTSCFAQSDFFRKIAHDAARKIAKKSDERIKARYKKADYLKYVNRQSELEKYVEASKQVLLKCDYLKRHDPNGYRRLQKIKVKLGFFRDGTTIFDPDGNYFGKIPNETCAFAEEDTGIMMFNRDNMNQTKNLSYYLTFPRKCQWETTIPHELLHLIGYGHSNEEEEEEMDDILRECKSLHYGNMIGFW